VRNKSGESRSNAGIPEMPTLPNAVEDGWGSDRIARIIRELDLPFICLNPGASFRGLHDSLVNLLGNVRPQMLLCLHEEAAVAIAHGYAKVSGKPLAVVLHSNVGLMHGTMAIFNAWCDRVPMMILGATGPVDANKRRPFIDWIHTSRDQASMTRHYTKWDDQPASVEATEESLLRGMQIATTAPCGPVYIVLDSAMQEARHVGGAPMPDMARYKAIPSPSPDPVSLDAAVRLLSNAKSPVILSGRVSRDPKAWADRVRLAEQLPQRARTPRHAARHVHQQGIARQAAEQRRRPQPRLGRSRRHLETSLARWLSGQGDSCLSRSPRP